MRFTYKPLELVEILAVGSGLYIKPLPAHVLRNELDNVLHNPVIPVERRQKLIILGCARQGVIGTLRKC